MFGPLLGGLACLALATVLVFFCFEKDLQYEHQIAAVLLLGLPLLVLCCWFTYRFCLGVLGVIADVNVVAAHGGAQRQQV